MGKINDLTGQRFGRLTVIKLEGIRNKYAQWLCQCDCGNTKIAATNVLRNGGTSSCGCYKQQMLRERPKTHGLAGTRLYKTWTGIKYRCYNSKATGYHNYGGRGISVCKEWYDDFTMFLKWAMENGYKDTLTLERIDNDGNYEPSNCKWATKSEQASNRRTSRIYVIDGVRKSIFNWCDYYKIDFSAVRWRLDKGVPIKQALTMKSNRGRRLNTRCEVVDNVKLF